MLVDKLKFVSEQMVKDLPQGDVNAFKNDMNSYINMLNNGATSLPVLNSGNSNVDKLVATIAGDLSRERDMPSSNGSKSYRGGRGSPYWYNPWWWNYWYSYWTPYYWWTPRPYSYGYGGITPVIGSQRKVGESNTGILDSVLDSVVDVQSMNLNCDENRVCNFNARFIKAPLYSDANGDSDTLNL
jgi:hypothetical protein